MSKTDDEEREWLDEWLAFSDTFEDECSDCFYWISKPGGEVGECRRFAERCITSSFEWCNKFVSKTKHE